MNEFENAKRSQCCERAIYIDFDGIHRCSKCLHIAFAKPKAIESYNPDYKEKASGES